ncbi:MAG TPA: two-component regulator propeller domain-containing protein [Thermoanaerobaculia bacterium]|nr:two-component regulator propeller domain-containing protein [Thermoanaerobaculia bacterium]
MTFRSIQTFGRLAALALWLGAAGLPSAAMAQSRIVRSFSMEDGLANPYVSSIFEDRDGFLWIGTDDGVSRFDGVAFTNFDHQQGVPSGRIHAFHQAPDGTLYVGGGNGAAVFDGERFIPVGLEGRIADRVVSIAGLPDGTVFFGGKMGLVKQNPDGRWEPLLQPGHPLLSDRSPSALLAAGDGTLYVGTGGKGLLAIRGERTLPLLSAPVYVNINALHEGRDRTIYIGTKEGLLVLRGGSMSMPPSTRGYDIQSISESEGGDLYLATWGSGVLHLRSATLEPAAPITTAHGLSHPLVAVVHASRGGPVIFGTAEGLDIAGTFAVETWTAAQGVPEAPFAEIAEDMQGSLYLATGQGVAILRGERWLPAAGEGFPKTTVYSMHAGSSGRLYLGDDQGRIRIFEAGNLLRVVELPKRDLVWAIVEGPDGAVYAAVRAGKLFILEGREVRSFGPPAGLSKREINALALATDGTVYLGTGGGLVTFRQGRFQVRTRQHGLVEDQVLSVHIGKDGSVYAGTSGGLSILRDGKFDNYTTAEGLTNNVIRCILEDDEGRLYLSTNRGVNVLDLQAPSPVSRVLPIGSPGRSLGSPVCLRDRRGRLWFGLRHALAVYDPAKDRPRNVPKALLTGLQVFKDRIPLESVLAHDRNDLTFSFAGIDLAAHLLRFRYRLAGLDREWTDTGQRSARYPNLLPGDYRFEVQAANDAGLWSAPAGLSFTIRQPPWWRRPALVLGLAAAAVALATALFAVLRVRQLLEVERLRAGIAADLHDQVGAGLTDIAILSEVASQKAGRLPELDRIAATAREMVDGLGDIVWLINPRRDSLGELFLRLKDSYAELFAHAGAELEAGDLSPFERVRLPMSWRQDLHLLFQEALRNALRHSGCRRAELSVTLRGRRLEVVLRDDGRGFDPERANGQGEGLATMRRRAGRLKGRLDFESSPAGTTVRFTGPAP